MNVAQLVIVFLCLCVSVKSEFLELYVSPTGSSSECSINAPCGSINDAFNQFVQANSTTQLSINMFGGDYAGEGNTDLTIPQELKALSIQAQSQSSVLIDCDNYFLKSVSIPLNITSLTIQGCKAFGIQTMNYDSHSMFISNVNMTYMKLGKAFAISDGSYSFTNVLTNNVGTAIKTNFSSSDSQIYIDGFTITNCDSGLLLSMNNGNSGTIQINEVSITNVYLGIEISNFQSAQLSNIQLNNVGNIDDSFFSLSENIISQNMLFGIKVSANTFNLEYISLYDCANFKLENSSNIPNDFSLYGIYVYNGIPTLKNITLESVALDGESSQASSNPTKLYGIYSWFTNKLELTNIHLKNVSRTENNNSEVLETHGIYSGDAATVIVNGLTLEYVGSMASRHTYYNNGIYMNVTDSITIDNFNLDHTGYNTDARAYRMVYFATSELNISNITMIDSNTITLYADTVEISNGYFSNNYIPLLATGNDYTFNNLQISKSAYSGIIASVLNFNLKNSNISDNNNFHPAIDFVNIKSNNYIDNCHFDNNIGGSLNADDFTVFDVSNSVFSNNLAYNFVVSGKGAQCTLNNVQFLSSNLTCSSSVYSYITSSLGVSFDEYSSTNCNIYNGISQIFYISPQATSTSSNCSSENNPCTSINQVIEDFQSSIDYFTFILSPGKYDQSNNNSHIQFPKTTTIYSQNQNIIFNCTDNCFIVENNEADLIINIQGVNTTQFNNANPENQSNAILFYGNNLFMQNIIMQSFSSNIVFNGNTISVSSSYFYDSTYGIVLNENINNCNYFSIQNSNFYEINKPIIFYGSDNLSAFSVSYCTFSTFDNFYFNLPANKSAALRSNTFSNLNFVDSYLFNINNGIWNIDSNSFSVHENQNVISFSGSFGSNYFSLSGSDIEEISTTFLTTNSPGNIYMSAVQFTDITNPIEVIQANNVKFIACSFLNCNLPLNISASQFTIDSLSFNNSGSTYFNSLGEKESFLRHVKHDNSSGFVIQSNGNWSIEDIDMTNTKNRPWSISSTNSVLPEFEFFDVTISQSSSSIIADFGGAIYADSILLYLHYVDIDGVTSSTYGGAVYTNHCSIKVQVSSSISSCSSGSGGAIYCDNCGTFDCDGTFYMNSASNYGGSIFIQGGDVHLSNLANFTSSMSNFGGGVYLNNSNSAYIDGYYYNNIASYYGGGLYVNSNSSLIAQFQGNYLNNQALNGAVISCCGNSSSCPVSVEEYFLKTSDNVNSQGSDDIACAVYDTSSENSSNTNTIPIGSYILYGTLGVVVIIVIIVVVLGAGYYIYRKKKRQNMDEYQALINE